MTVPTTAPTTPFTIPAGGQPVRITDGGNAPAGLALVNQGAHGGTVWISAGPSGQAGAIPLGPGATMQWTDPGTVPYAYLSPGATADETLILTGQAQAYTNPSVVAAALVAQGIPSTMLDTGYGTYRIPVTTSAPALTVTQSASLIVGVSWPQAPAGANVVRLRFDDPALPDLPPVDFYCTNNNAVEQGLNVWQVPVVAPRLTVTNLQPPDNNNGDAYVQLVGTNRTPDRFRMLGAAIGAKTLYAACAVIGITGPAQATAGDYTQIGGSQGTLTGTGPMTRFTGPVSVQVSVGNVTGGGIVVPTWIDETGRVNGPRAYAVAASGGANAGQSDFSFQWNHPAVPVYWRYVALAANAANYFRVTVTGSP